MIVRKIYLLIALLVLVSVIFVYANEYYTVQIYTTNRYEYLIDFTNQEGFKYTIPYLSNKFEIFGDLKFGNGDHSFYFKESDKPSEYIISVGSYFILSSVNSPIYDKWDTRVLKYEGIDFTNRHLTFTDLATGTKQISYGGGTYAGTNLLLNGINYAINVDTRTGNLSIDLNADGKMYGGNAIVGTESGALLVLGNSQDPINPVLKILNNNENIEIPFLASKEKAGIGIDVSKISGVNFKYSPEPNFAEGYSNDGTMFKLYDVSGSVSLEELTIIFYKNNQKSSSNAFNVTNNLTASVINPFIIDVIHVKNGASTGILEEGMRFGFKATIPNDEPYLTVWISDWLNLNGASIISNGNAFIKYNNRYYAVSSKTDYSESEYFQVVDEDPNAMGLQASFELLVKIPVGTPKGDYSANFGVKSFRK